MTQELTPTTGNHPLRTRGAGRALYAGGLACDLVWLVVLVLMSTGVIVDPSGTGLTIAAAGIGLQLASRALRRRAWWYVPLRNAGPLPDRVDTAFWTVFAVAVVISTLVVVQRPASEARSTGLWPLLLFAAAPMWFPWNDRNTPEPPGHWGSRIAPCGVAVLAVLVLGTTHARFGVTTALVAGTVVVAGTVLSPIARRRLSA